MQVHSQLDKPFLCARGTGGVTAEVLEDEWWKRHTTAEALHDGSDFDDWQTSADIENRVLNMELVYMKPDKILDPKSTDPENKLKSLEKKENSELMDLGKSVLE